MLVKPVLTALDSKLQSSWNVMAHAQKPDFVFRRKGPVHLIRRGRQFRRLLAAEVCASAVVMLDTPCSDVVWRVLVTHSIRQFILHFPSRASPCAITFQLGCTKLIGRFTAWSEGATSLTAVATEFVSNCVLPCFVNRTKYGDFLYLNYILCRYGQQYINSVLITLTMRRGCISIVVDKQ